MFRSRYGYVSLGTGSVYPISGISSTFKELESIGTSEPMTERIKIEIEEQKREFDVEIGSKVEEFENWIIFEMKLNGHNGRCLVVKEDFNENVNNFLNESEKKLPQDLVIAINDIRAKNVELSGGKGASLAALTQIASTSQSKFEVPKGIIVTTNAYKELIEESDLIVNEINRLEKAAW